MNAPTWLPDWRKAEDYPEPRSLDAWRWEFLRRLPAYQQAWKDGLKAAEKTYRENPSLARTVMKKRPVTTRPRAIETWARKQWDAGERLFALSGNAERFRQFGLKLALNPASNCKHGELTGAFERPDFGEVLELRNGEATELYRAGVVVIAFDLKWDLHEQLRDAKQTLLDERRDLNIGPVVERVHPRRWKTYLRALDAKASGASLRDIARGLLGAEPGAVTDLKSKAHEVLDAAVRVQTKLTS